MCSPSWGLACYWVNTCFVLLCTLRFFSPRASSLGTRRCSLRTAGARWLLDGLFQDIFPIDFLQLSLHWRNRGRREEGWCLRGRGGGSILHSASYLEDSHAIWHFILLNSVLPLKQTLEESSSCCGDYSLCSPGKHKIKLMFESLKNETHVYFFFFMVEGTHCNSWKWRQWKKKFTFTSTVARFW